MHKYLSQKKIRFAGINEDDLKDELLISFNENANNEDDSFDSEKRFSSNADLIQVYTIHSSKKYIIDSYNEYAGGRIISVGYKTGKAGTFKLKLTELVNITDNATIQLEDLDSGYLQTMNEGDEYSFTSESGTFNDRFLIHVLPSVTTDLNESYNKTYDTKVYAINSSLYVRIPELTQPRYELYTVSGKLLQSDVLSPSITNKIYSEHGGLILVKIISKEKTFTQKVFIKK